ncbi:hypothetical protein [Roseibium sp.]|uniref:hypothetical protein n=1 Tax=Roseibium sp. TaxID=1936156 RepID=UPI003BAF2C70
MFAISLTFDEKPADVRAIVQRAIQATGSIFSLSDEDSASVTEYKGSYEIVITIGQYAASGVALGALALYGEKVGEWTISLGKKFLSNESSTKYSKKHSLAEITPSVISEVEQNKPSAGVDVLCKALFKIIEETNSMSTNIPVKAYRASIIDRHQQSASLIYNENQEIHLQFQSNRVDIRKEKLHTKTLNLSDKKYK